MTAMEKYRALFLTHSKEVYDMQHFEAESDSHAIDHGVRRYRSNIGWGFEIWNKNRRIYRWPEDGDGH